MKFINRVKKVIVSSVIAVLATQASMPIFGAVAYAGEYQKVRSSVINNFNVYADLSYDGETAVVGKIKEKNIEKFGKNILLKLNRGKKATNSVSMPAYVAEKIADGAKNGISVRFKDGSIHFDDAALKFIASNSDSSVKFGLKVTDSKDANNLLPEQLEAVENMDAQLIVEASANGKDIEISSLDSGIMTIGIQYALKAGQTPEGLSVYHIAEDGTAEKLSSNYTNNVISFTSDKISVFIVAYEN